MTAGARLSKPRPDDPAGETKVARNTGLRQAHRWMGIGFTLSVACNFAAMPWGQPPAWVICAPLPPLFFLMASGLIMFALPYFRARRAKRGLATG